MSYNSGNWEPKIKILAGLVPSGGHEKAPLLYHCRQLLMACLQLVAFLSLYRQHPDPCLHLHVALLLCMCLCPDFPLLKWHHSYWNKTHPGAVWPHPNLTNYICNDPIYKYGHIQKYWRLGLQQMNFRGTQVNPQNLVLVTWETQPPRPVSTTSCCTWRSITVRNLPKWNCSIWFFSTSCSMFFWWSF